MKLLNEEEMKLWDRMVKKENEKQGFQAAELGTGEPGVIKRDQDGLILADRHYGGKSQEIRVTDPLTGGEKGTKIARFSLIPPEFLWALAEHYGKGARKYADRNWERGYKWSLGVDALERHLTLWKQGEDLDPETGSSHLIAAAWHCVALFIFQLRGLGSDDVRTKGDRVAWNPLPMPLPPSK